MASVVWLRRYLNCRRGSRRSQRSACSGLLAAIYGFPFLLLFSAAALAAGPPQDSALPNVNTQTIHYSSGELKIEAFLAKPATAGKHPAILIVHDNQGLDDSIKDIARRFASAGFVALAPDFTSRLGGRRSPDETAMAVMHLSPELSVADTSAAFQYLQKDPDVDGAKISTVGFGWGGWRSFMLALSAPEVYRTVIYCGTTPSERLGTLHAPVLAHYAQLDFRTTGGEIFTEKEMETARKKFTYFIYPNVNRGFYAPGPQYNVEAATLAWTRTLEFLK